MKKIIFITLGLSILLLCWFIYKQSTYTHITIQFKEMRGFKGSIPVYYKGIIIGKTTDKKHTHDYQHTLVKAVLYPKNLHLPSNTEIELRKVKRGRHHHDFLELIYPKNPTDKLIADGSYLKGTTTVDMEDYLRNQRPDDLEEIKTNLTLASENLNNALSGLSELFIILQNTVKENQSNIKGVTRNIKNATGNLNQVTTKVNSSIKQEQLNNTMSRIENSINNLDQISKNLDTTSSSLNQNIPSINNSIQDTQEILANTNAISCGVRQTLRKPFGGLRLIFGKTINESKCCPCGRSNGK